MARNPRMAMKKKKLCFAKNDRVEVEHLHNSISCAWYEATIRRTHLKTGGYTVIYSTLHLPNGKPLWDVVDSCHVRPLPPSNITSSPITTNQMVEAFYNDGWWIGVVISKFDDVGNGNKFVVSLSNSNGKDEKMEFASCKVRVHHDWDPDNDKWVLVSKNRQKQDVKNEDRVLQEKKHGNNQKLKMPCAKNVIVLSDDD